MPRRRSEVNAQTRTSFDVIAARIDLLTAAARRSRFGPCFVLHTCAFVMRSWLKCRLNERMQRSLIDRHDRFYRQTSRVERRSATMTSIRVCFSQIP